MPPDAPGAEPLWLTYLIGLGILIGGSTFLCAFVLRHSLGLFIGRDAADHVMGDIASRVVLLFLRLPFRMIAALIRVLIGR